MHGSAGAPSEPGEAIGGALAVKMAVGAGETAEAVFVVAWHAPLARFGGSGDAYWRRYTAFYGRDPAGIKRLVASALLNWRAWERAVVEWQAPILRAAQQAHGDAYAAALLNELHWLTEGGTVWTDGGAPVLPSDVDLLLDNDAAPIPHTDVPRDSVLFRPPPLPAAAPGAVGGSGSPSGDVTRSEAMRQMPPPAPGLGVCDLRADSDVGHFLLLSSDVDGTYNDVESLFYASGWALLQTFPKLELSLQRDAAVAIFMQDREQAAMLDTGKSAQRKQYTAVAHDLGAPHAAPWRQLNAYAQRNTANWRDLPSMFVLQVYRDFAHTRDRQFAADVWPAVEQCIEQLQRYASSDSKQDGLISHSLGDNGRPPIDTSLGIAASGASAYANSLWLAALTAAIALARELGLDADASVKRWQAQLSSGKTSFHSTLWNVAGRHYSFDSHNTQPGLCLASQLVGQWFVDAGTQRAVGVNVACLVIPLTLSRVACNQKLASSRLLSASMRAKRLKLFLQRALCSMAPVSAQRRA